MNIKSFGPGNYIHVTTNETDRNEYLRFGPDSWYCFMGESLEICGLRTEDLEEAFQRHLRETV